jgi:hypothetical protein
MHHNITTGLATTTRRVQSSSGKTHCLVYLGIVRKPVYPSMSHPIAKSHSSLPPKQSERVLRERELALSIPASLLDAYILDFRCVNHIHVVTSNSVHLHLVRLQARQLNLKVLLLIHIGNSEVDPPVIAERSTAVQVRSFNRVADPVRVRAASVLWGPYVQRKGVAAHVLGEQQQRPPRGLLNETILGRHQGRDDVYALCDSSHAHVFRLADEAVQEDGDGEGIGEGVLFLCAKFAGGADGVPDVPLVEADSLAGNRFGNFVLDAGEVDKGGCHLDRAFCCPWGCGVGHVVLVSGVDVDGVHVDQALSSVTTEAVDIPLHALVQHIVVPG